MSYQDIFHITNWEKATYNEKLAALQALENDYAARQGRPPCTIQPEELDPDEVGYYFNEDNTILINKEFLIGLDPEHEWAHISHYMCVNTILHEGRHAYQYFAMSHDVHHDKEEVRKWRENAKIYYTSEIDLYRLQPLERDAYDYAETETNNIFADLEANFGENRWYRYFSNIFVIEKNEAEISALNHYGLDYIQEIDQRISDEYKKKLEKELAPKKLPDLSNKSPKDILDSFKFLKVSGQLKDKDMTGVRDIRNLVSEAVEERKALSEVINWKERDSELER